MATIEELDAALARKQKLARIDELIAQKTGQPQPQETPQATQSGGGMMGYIKRGAQRTMQATAESAQRIGQGPSDAISGADRQTPETKAAPEFAPRLDANFARDAFAQMKAITAMDPAEQAQILASSIEGAATRQDEKGNWLIEFDNDKGERVYSVVNQPGLSMQDLNAGAFSALLAVPAARLTAAGKGLLGKLLIGTGSAATTEQAQQMIQEQAGGSYDGADVLVAGGTAGLVEGGLGAARGVGKMAQRRMERKIGAQEDGFAKAKATVDRAEEVSRATGVELGRAQKTQSPIDELDYRLAKTNPGGSQVARDFDVRQNKQIEASGERLLDSISDSGAMERGASRARSAADGAIEKLEKARKDATDKLFMSAKAADPFVDTAPVRSLIDAKLAEFPEGIPARSYFEKVKTMLAPAKKGDKETTRSLLNIHRARRQIDEWINFEGKPKLSADGAEALKDIRAALNEAIGASGPAGAKFRQADAIYEQMSEPIKALNASIIGKIARKDDATLHKVVTDLFNPEVADPTVLLKAKREIEAIDKEAWRDIYRMQLQRKLGAARDVPGESGGNRPSTYWTQLFSKPRETDMLLRAAPDAETAKNVNYFKEMLELTQIGRRVDSGTQALSKRERYYQGKGVSGFLSKFMTPKDNVVGAARDYEFESRMKALAELMTNPKWQPEMAIIRKLENGSSEAEKRMRELIENIVRVSAQTANDSGQSSEPIPGADLPNLNL